MRPFVLLGLVVLALLPAGAAPAQETFIDAALHRARRAKFAGAMEGGIAIVMSARKNQDFIYEFFVPHADNHDFIYLTGLEGVASWDSALVLCPGAEKYKEILYTPDDPEYVKKATGIEQVFSYSRFLEHLSDALTDYSLMRTHQRGSKEISSDISRALGTRKIVYFNYPRFVNLEQVPPPRLEVAQKLKYYSPEVQLRDASDILNRLRMIHDPTEIELLRKASDITVKAFVESIKAVRAGLTTQQIGAIVEFVFAYEHAEPSFRTNVSISGPPRRPRRQFVEGTPVPRLGPWPVKDGDLISYDIGAEYGHQTCDFGRTVPVSGKFTPEQRKIYDTIVGIQKQLIAAVKPGGTFRKNQELKDQLVAEAGLAQLTGTYGISHFVGMEIHDVGDYDIPFEPGMCFVIEWRIQTESFAMRFEDAILVTATGQEWLTGHAPITAEEFEKVMAEKGFWES
jgi:Xaa-Pro aminopeptidase